MKMRFTLIAAAAMGLISTTASAVDWGGYTRVGPGQKQAKGDGKRCFNGGEGTNIDGSQAPGHGGIGRLGNECETYGEFGLSQTMTAGGVSYKALLMTNFGGGGSTPANTPAVNQLYVEAKGFDVWPAATFWIGRRFYHRADVHFDDSFYVLGGSAGATGAGVDTINTGFGSLGLAVFRKNDASTADNAGSLLNVDLQDMPVNPNGKLRLTASFSKFSGTGGKNGTGLSAQHIQTGIFGGADNTAWLQWSKGSTGLDMFFADDLKNKQTDVVLVAGGRQGSDYKRWRIADSLVWLKGPLTFQTLLHYGRVEEPAGLGTVTAKTFSVAGRVAYALTNNFKLQGELGTASTKLPTGGKQNVTKLTIAPTLTVGPNYYDRPELRFYVSGFSYNDAYKNATLQSKKSKAAAGFQAEIWF